MERFHCLIIVTKFDSCLKVGYLNRLLCTLIKILSRRFENDASHIRFYDEL